MALFSKFPLLCMFMIWATFLTTAHAAGHAALAPTMDCSSLVLNMADCLSFVTAGSTTKKPEGTCCSGLKTVLKTDPQCLCEGFKNSAQFGVILNVTKALALPSECHVSAPSVSNCGLSIGSVTGGAPALSPLPLPPSSVAGAPSTEIVANEIAPTPALGISGSCGLTISLGILFLTMVLAAIF